MKTKTIKLGDGCSLTVTLIDRQGMPLKLSTLKNLVISIVSDMAQDMTFTANSDNTLTILLTHESNMTKPGMYDIRARGELSDGQSFDYLEHVIEVRELNESTDTTFVTSLVLREVNGIDEKEIPDIFRKLGYASFSAFEDYEIENVVIFGNSLYKFTANHTAGIWNADNVEETSFAKLIGQCGTSFKDLGYEDFDPTETYAAGDVVIYEGSLYKFTASHTGAWIGTDATPTSVEELIKEGGGSGHSPYIGQNGNWYEWDDATQQFVDTGTKAQGEDGEQGPQGPQGPKGNTGSSVDYPFELVNNLTTNDATKALSAAMGKKLHDSLCYPYIGEEVNPIASSAHGHLREVNINCLFIAMASTWDDLPTSGQGNYIFRSSHYTTDYMLQEVFSVREPGCAYSRIVQISTKTVYRNWTSFQNYKPLKVLALGDSICKGVRNDEKGFVGDLLLDYKNIGVSGATITNVVTAYKNIPQQLVDESSYNPDVIIANGGVNDYVNDAVLGDVPSTPVSSDTEAASLDRSVFLDSIQYLFYTMVKKFPKAQRFFLIAHKMYKNGVGYYPTRNNSKGYSMQDMHDAIVKTCGVYGVKVIDVFENGFLNTKFSQYVSDTPWSEDPSITNTQYVDSDGVHPTALGYKECYVPIVAEAIGIGTVKS